MQSLGPLNAVHVAPVGDRRGPPVVLLHGIGLGAWIWERDQALLAAQGLESWALDLPGHGDAQGEARLVECYDAVVEALSQLEEPALVGHSAGGLVAQVVAHRVRLHSLVLVAAVPCAPLLHTPTAVGLRTILPHLPDLFRGRGLRLRAKDYLATGMDRVPDAERVLQRIGPWPNGLVWDLVRRRPRLPRLDCPVLVTHGGLDRVSPLSISHRLAEHHGALMWRFDDLGHIPQLEPGGERHLQAIAGWLLDPREPVVREIQSRGGREKPAAPRSDSPFGDRRKR